MRHFDHLDVAEQERIFHQCPRSFSRDDDASFLAVALGATLYTPASRPALAQDITKGVAAGVMSMVLCLEDAISDQDVPSAERNVIDQLRTLAAAARDCPLIFVRVRSADQIPRIVANLGADAHIVAGFVLPKFTEDSGPAFLESITEAGRMAGLKFWAMPVLESREIAFRETRTNALLRVHQLLDKHRENVLAVRIGATDLSAAFALRRSRDLTVYDVHVVADAIADIVNVLGRADGSGFVITGPVWEYFSGDERIFKPQLRETPFVQHEVRALRAELVARHLDGLIREVVLDRTNGLTGKTVIHPSHVAAVHALSVVSHEEFSDACDVLAEPMAHGGVSASRYGNKMNESKPHRTWAQNIQMRARAFGVAREDVTFVDLLATFFAR